MFSFRSVKHKILLLSLSSVLMVALAMVAIIIYQKGGLKLEVGQEMDELAKAETSKIAKDVYLMARAADETLQGQLDNNLAVIERELKQKGAWFSSQTVSWDAKDQETGRGGQVVLPRMMVGDKWLGQNRNGSTATPIVDEMSKLLGGTVTIFQRMNNAGDMLRVATNVINENGERAIGTYAANRGKNGKPDPVLQAVLSGSTYKGTVRVLGKMYLAAYGPIHDASHNVIGMTVSAISEDKFISLRKGIMDITVGKSGYVFILNGKGKHQGNYVISYKGQRDGENIWDAKDAAGNSFVQSIIGKALDLKQGETDFERYPWQNKGETTSRMKLTAITYFEPWDWVIGSGAYADDFQAAKARIDDALNKIVMWGVVGALLLLAIVGVIAVMISGKISNPLKQMVEAARSLAEGDIEQSIEVNTRDEVGDLGEAFQSMIDAQKSMAQAANSVSKGEIDVSIVPRSNRDILALSLKGMVEVIQKVMGETNGLIESVKMGDLKKRGDSQSFEGGYKDLIGGINQLVEAFVGPIDMTADYVRRISMGDIPDKITDTYHGDFNDIVNSINQCVEAIDKLVTDMNGLVEAALNGQLEVRADSSAHKGDFSRIVKGVNNTLDATIAPVNESSLVLERLAERDLTARVVGDYKGGHAKIKSSLNTMADALQDAMSIVASSSKQVASASNQIASSSQAVAEGASEQASSLEETSSSLEEMAAMTKQNADNAQQGNSMAQTTRQAADEGRGSMEKMITAMSQIREAAEGTSAIIRDINEIAFQTNLLALNAAVEAARAGEAGRGFAVVAEEVRNLALRSKEAAKKTEDLINQSVVLAENGATISEEVNVKLEEIVGSVGKVSDIVGEIAAASQEQSRGIEQVNTAVGQMDQVTQQNAANSEESSSAAQELSGQAQELEAMVTKFKLDSRQSSAALSNLNTGGSIVSASKASQARGSNGQSPSNGSGIHLDPEDIIPLDSDPDFKDF